MKKLIYTLGILMVFPFSFISCQNAKEDKKESKSTDVVLEGRNSLLWKIEGNGLKQASYLFGTMHLIESDYFVFPDALKEKVKSCDKIVMELPGMPNAQDAKALMMAEEGEGMRDLLNEEQYDSLIQYMEGLGFSKESFEMMFGKMKPFAGISAISMMNFKGKTESYEMTLMSLAKKNEIEMDGLESIEEQLGFFDSISKENMVQMIMESIRKDKNESAKEMKKMMEIYKSQNLDSLGTFMIEQSPELMASEEILLTGRNKDWIPKIKKKTSENKCFIAVGAAHLVGENGVIALLEKEGFTLTPISTDK